MPTRSAGSRAGDAILPAASGLDVRDLWFRIRHFVLAGYYGWFLIPLLLASIARPFALWDYFTSGGMFHHGRPIEWGTLAGNYFYNLLTGAYVIRPSVVLLYDLQTLVFGGEYWLWYIVKWIAFGITVGLVVALLGRLGCGWAAKAAAASFLLFHPARFTLMLHAPDGWVALGMMAQLCLLVESGFDVARMSRGRQVAWFALALFTLGAKEVAWVFQVALVCFAGWMGWRAWVRLAPQAALVAGWALVLTHGFGRTQGFTFKAWVNRFFEQAKHLSAQSTLHGVDILLVVVGIASLYFAIRGWRTAEGRLTLFCWATSVGMIAFVTIPPLVALRYAIPPVYLMAIPLGLAVERLAKPGLWVAGLLIVVYPLLTAGHIYRQELAYQHQFFEISTALERMKEKAAGGYGLVMTALPGDFEGEALATIRRYFTLYGPMWYGVDGSLVVGNVKEGGWPNYRFTTLSLFEPERMAEAGMDMRRLEAVYALVPGDFGVLGKWADRYYRLDRLLGRTDMYWYDLGGPEIRTTPHFYLYVVGTPEEAGRTEWRLQELPAGRRAGAF